MTDRDPEENQRIDAHIQALKRGIFWSIVGLTWRAHVLLLGMTQILIALATGLAAIMTNDQPQPHMAVWWMWGIPNLVGLALTVLLPLPFRVDR